MKKFYGFGLLLLGLWSCSSEEGVISPEEGTPQEIPSFSELRFTVSDTARVISTESKAMEVADRFLSTYENKTRSGVEVNVTTVFKENGEPAMYVVNYGEEGGFVIVSATKDTEPILAYSDTGSFRLDNIGESPAGMWLDDTKLYVEHSSELPDSVKLSAAQQWERLTSTTVPAPSLQTRGWTDPEEVMAVYYALEYYRSQGYEIYENPSSDVHTLSPDMNQALDNLSDQPDPDGFSQREKSFLLKRHTSNEEKVLPMITTRWHQFIPYNGKLVQEYHKPLYLGCVTIAVAQLMKHYKKPNGGFQYDKMPDQLSLISQGEGYDILTDFLFNIGHKLEIDYANGSNSAKHKKAIELFKSYGFINLKDIKYDFYSVKNYLNNGPVYLRADSDGGEGHAWVCDGYNYYTWQEDYMLISYNGQYMDVIPTACFNTLYTEWKGNGSHSLHMIWGWDDSNDGYYSDNWEVIRDLKLENFSKERRALVNFR